VAEITCEWCMNVRYALGLLYDGVKTKNVSLIQHR